MSEDQRRIYTEEEIEAGRTAKGGFSREQLEKWGVPWPPPKGWKKRLMGVEAQPDGNYSGEYGCQLRMTITPERHRKLKAAVDRSAIELHQYALIMLRKMIDRGEFLEPEDWWQGTAEDLARYKAEFCSEPPRM